VEIVEVSQHGSGPATDQANRVEELLGDFSAQHYQAQASGRRFRDAEDVEYDRSIRDPMSAGEHAAVHHDNHLQALMRQDDGMQRPGWGP
jgi:hypothetical protein